jgi:hypothetical protein
MSNRRDERQAEESAIFVTILKQFIQLEGVADGVQDSVLQH